MFPDLDDFTLNSTNFAELNQSRSVRKKNIQIVAFRGAPIVEAVVLEEKAFGLSARLKLLLHEENPEVSLEGMYGLVDVLVQYDQREALFDILSNRCTEFLNDKLGILLKESDDKFLEILICDWIYYGKKVATLKNVYLRYDRSRRNDFRFNTVHLTCMDLFKSIIILHPVVSPRITRQLLGAVATERAGFAIEKDRMEFVLFILNDLSLYEDMFEAQFLTESISHFQKASNIINQSSVETSGYLRHVRKHIQEEEERTYLQQGSTNKVIQILHREMIEAHLLTILNNGFERLMNENSLQDLKLLYQLLSNVSEGIKSMVEYFEKYVSKLCLIIVKQSSEKVMVQDLIDFKERLDAIVLQCLQANPTFCDLIKRIFQKTINIRTSQSALYLARYFDGKLRAKNISEEDLEDTFNKVMVMFRFLQGKDIFEAFYRKDLSKRLLFGKSTNQDIEYSIIAKLKEECGEGFTSKIEGMLRDINLSKVINSSFKEFLLHAQHNFLDISVSVLTSSFWTKITSNTFIILPDDLLNYQAIFAKYYSSIHTGRKLDWQPHLGHCILKVSFKSAAKELVVSLFQAVTLLLFQDSNKLTTAEIQELTKMDRKDLLMTLHSLSCGKFKILIKQPQSGAVTMEDAFEFNRDFKQKLFRIKINQAQLKESADDVKSTEKGVLADRQFQIDAAIVRILKSRKVITHNELVSELFKLMEVPVSAQDLKTRIALLIEREYITSDFNNAATYTYVA